MKKLKIVLGSIAAALAASGMAACAPASNEPNVFTVTFQNPWGGVSEESVNNGGFVMRPEDPERPGYKFDGWYLNGVEYTFGEAVTGDITLVAKYTSVLGGEGTESDPFTVDNAEELALVKKYIEDGVSGFATAHYLQTADITSTIDTIPEFAGIYDGGGHSIELVAKALFGKLTGAVKNLTLHGGVSEKTAASVGALANIAENASISHVHVENTNQIISGLKGVTGGIVGELIGGRMEFCTSNTLVWGKTAGGIAGKSSGTIINCTSASRITGEDFAGGIVGILEENGLVQNVGIGNDKTEYDATSVVCNNGVAGGVVGKKHVNSAVYRAFMYGSGGVSGKKAGAAVGVIDSDTPVYSNIVDCSALSSFSVYGSVETTDNFGVYTVDDFADITLPAAVWDLSGDVPMLKEQTGVLPQTVVMTVNGNATTVEYGYKADRELFTAEDEHYSTLIETDTNVNLKTVLRVHSSYTGSEFTSGNEALRFAVTGAKLRKNGGDFADLDYVLTYAYTDEFFYVYDFADPEYGYFVDYDAPVSVYTDGKDYYAFTVTKQYVGPQMYMAFLESFVLSDNGWKHYKSWAPKSDYSGGAYKYSGQIIGGTVTYMFIIDDTYTTSLSGDGGYYATRYVRRVYDDDGEYTESREVIGKGETVMYLGDNENNKYITAFSYEVSYDGTVNFFYRDEKGKLISSEGIEIEDATNDFLLGTWFDGTDKFVFDTKNNTVNSVPYTVENGKIKFTYNNKAHELKFAPGALGSYTLVDTVSGNDLILATYTSDALNGTWVTEDGKTVVVTGGDATYVTVDGTAATEIHDDVYNGMQALCFTVGDNEYRLVTYTDKSVTILVRGDIGVYAFDKEMLVKDYVGTFSTFAGGIRTNMTIDEDLNLAYGSFENAVMLTPKKISDGLAVEYVMVASIKTGTVTEEYVLNRLNDVISVRASDSESIFTDSEILDRFTVTYTNGTEILEITDGGNFYRYFRDGEKGNYTALTAAYRQERYEYGLENRGFVLCYEDGDNTMFFYADTDTTNIRLFRAWVNSVGNDTASLVTNFVPESALVDIYGNYTRTFNGAPDTLTFGQDGSLKRSYTDNTGVEHEDESITWYPVVNYNSKTDKTWLIAYTHEVVDGAGFTTRIDFELTGLSWGVNSYLNSSSATSAITEFIDKLFVCDDGRALSVSATQIKVRAFSMNSSYNVTEKTYNFDEITVTDINTVTISLYESIGGSDETTVAVLNRAGDNYSVKLVVNGSDSQIFENEEKLDPNSLVGEYAKDGVAYKFTVDESWLGTSISLKIGTKTFNYSQSRGITIMTDGTQALALNSGTTYKFVWKNSNGSLMVCDSLDASNAVEIEDATVANMPNIDKLQELLDGQEFIASDNSRIVFEYGNGFGGSYFCANIDDGDDLYLETYRKENGKYILFFESDNGENRCVVVNLNSDNVVTGLLVGRTENSANKEYLPEFIPPTSDEIKAMLDGKMYMNGTNAISFSNSYGFSMQKDSSIYDLVRAEYANGAYTFVFKPYIGNNVTVVVEFDSNNITKITVDEVVYVEFNAPTIEEVFEKLADKTYTAEDNSSIVFGKYPGNLYYMNIVGDENEIEYDYDKEEDEASISMNVYTVLMFDEADYQNFKRIKITLNADGSVNKVTMDNKDYFSDTVQ